jgi:hypothetical protein
MILKRLLPILPLLLRVSLAADPSTTDPSRDVGVTSLLTHPEQVFVTPSGDTANFALSLDAQPLSYDSPEILFQTNSDTTAFVAGAWKDSTGEVIHQREVLIVKPDYGIVVDHLYGSQQHEITSVTTMEAAKVREDGGMAVFTLGTGKEIITRHLVPAMPPTMLAGSEPHGTARVTETCRATLPSPYATAFFPGGASAPRFTFVKPSNPMIVKCSVALHDGRTDDVAIAWESRDLHVAGKRLKGWAVVVRQGPGAGSDLEIK